MKPVPFVFGWEEAAFTALACAIILAILGPRLVRSWMQEKKQG